FIIRLRGPVAPPIDCQIQFVRNRLAEKRKNGRAFRRKSERERNRVTGSERKVRTQAVSAFNEFDVTAKCEQTCTNVDPPSKLAPIFDNGCDSAIIEAWSKIDNQRHFALLAFD